MGSGGLPGAEEKKRALQVGVCGSAGAESRTGIFLCVLSLVVIFSESECG